MNLRTPQAGWTVAGLLALSLSFVMGSGFQDREQKIGTVSMAKVFNDSEYVKKQDSELKSSGAVRTAVFQFANSYKVLPRADLQKFREVSSKDKQSDADRAEIERLKKAGQAADARLRELQTKGTLSEAEKTELAGLTKNATDNQAYLQTLQQEFMGELQDRQEKLRTEALEKVKAAVAAVAQKQGYSIILTDEVAPYSANDLTAEALKEMNARNK